MSPARGYRAWPAITSRTSTSICFARRLPAWAARLIGWLWKPGAGWVRVPVGILLILGGIIGFLPILGFWMVPLGLVVVAKDFPPLQPVLVRFLDWIESKWPSK